jgi:RNA polymerase sigma-70 factor (ECF subfamily)
VAPENWGVGAKETRLKRLRMDKETLEFMVRSNQAELYRYVKYLGADSGTAEDVVQDAFLAAFRSKRVPDLENAKLRGAWLRGIARNTFLNYCRRRRRSPVVTDPDIMEKAEKYWASQFLGEGDGFDYIEALRQCVKKLAEKSRKLIEMRYSSKTSRTELAKTFNMSEDGVKSFLRRVRTTLGKCITASLEAEGVNG